MRRICVFCGSNQGVRPAYAAAARRMGEVLAEHGIAVVYGGGRVGLMGALADAALTSGGEVIGVIPEALVAKELAHESLTQLHVVGSMHERKALMADLSDAFIAMPGGYGTLEELFEVVTWAQLGLHHKPVGLLNVAGYFDLLLSFADHAISQGFVPNGHRDLLMDESDPELLLELLQRYRPSDTAKWIDRTED